MQNLVKLIKYIADLVAERDFKNFQGILKQEKIITKVLPQQVPFFNLSLRVQLMTDEIQTIKDG